jgi:hypothetical protein
VNGNKLRSGLPDYLSDCVKRCPSWCLDSRCSGCEESGTLADAVKRFAAESRASVESELAATVQRHSAVVEELAAAKKVLAELVEAAENFSHHACRTDMTEHWTLDRAIAAGRSVLQ